MATVRIYKVAELLGTTSQEVVALLKRDHGIEVKSASSSIEEVVARQFVDRLARQRGVTLPTGNIFAETPASKGAPGKKPTLAKKPEPPKPAAAVLPPPRLVKSPKPQAPLEGAPAPAVETPAPVAPEPAPVVAAAPPPAPARPVVVPTGRIVPPTLRLRVEEAPKAHAPATVTETPAGGAAPAAAGAARPAAEQPPAEAEPSQEAPAPAAQAPAAPAPQPIAAAPAARIVPPRPAGAPPPSGPRPLGMPRPLVSGGPRPLPSQPIRTPSPSSLRPGSPPARPAVGPRPPMRPSYQGRPGAPRPATPRRDHGPRESYRGATAVAPAAPPPITKSITLAEGMTVKDLADKLELRAKDVLKKLLDKGMMLTINTTLDTETATSIARDFGADVQMRSFEEELSHLDTVEAKPEDQVTRAPVVTVMGHVDHGKTTLLDAIRTTRVAEREAGGITQHIGAYHVQVHNRSVVFLDTPGHEAFTMMRARGARVTDVVVLVVAADDGVMPQTKEAIDHARAAGVPVIVAINKIDKADANAERVKKELSDLNLVPEEWGGQTVTVEVSAKKKQNIETLLEMILLVTDIGELKASPKRGAIGTVLEAKLDKGRGPVATVLIQNGTLHVGDTVIAGPIVGKVRALIDDRGHPVKAAGPSTPVEVLGLAGLPQPGDSLQAITDAAKARQVATFRQTQAKDKALSAKASRLTLESLQQQIAEGGIKELPVIIKADVQGSAEVLADTLSKQSDEKVKVRIIHSGVGAINESDVLLASASNAIVIGFNVRPDRNAADLAERERVDVRLHSVIYNVIDEMKKATVGLLEPTLKEVRLGIAEVRETFKVPKVGTVAGCMVTDGRITRSGDVQARLLRDHVVVYEGKIGSLRRFKDDVSEVKSGFECGISFERYHDLKVGDVIEAFVVERIAATG